MPSRRVLAISALLALSAGAVASMVVMRRKAPTPTRAVSSAREVASVVSSSKKAPSPPPAAPVRAGAPSMVHLDPHHTNRSPFRAPRAPHVAWTYDAGGAIEAAPAIANANEVGWVIVASLSGRVAALDLAGAPKWSVELGQRAYGSALVVGDEVFVGIDGGQLYDLSAKTGATRWRLHTDGDADTGAVPLANGGLAFAAGHVVYALRADGSVRWRYKSKRKVFSSPALTDDGTLVFGGQDDALTALKEDGSVLFKVDLGGDSDASPAIADDGRIYAGSDAGEVVAVSPKDGAIRWRTNVGGFVRGPLSVRRDGVVLASTYGPTPAIVALAPSSGAVLWRFPIQGTGAKEMGLHGAPIEDADGTLVFGGQDDFVYALDGDGALAWRVKLGGDIDATVVLASDGVLYAGCEDGKLYALRD